MANGKSSREAMLADLARAMAGEAIDWKRRSIPAEELASGLKAVKSDHATVTLVGADIVGDVLIDGIGESTEPLRLQLIGCRIKGVFRARSSRWRELIFARCIVGALDLPGARISGNLVIDDTKSAGFIELRSAEIGGHFTLHDAHCAKGDRAFGATLRDSRIARGLDGRGLIANGGLDARAIQVGGDLRLDGAQLDASGADEPKALDLADARIAGRLALCHGATSRFVTKGRIHLDGAEVASLDCRAALMDGLDQPALVADQLIVRGAVDLSGLSERGGPPFEAHGALGRIDI